ncbi:hypothetical protein T484DRAFT_1956138 [Baffinella frigidus]|nr:hypothetical protein T484DRAFT_1956138 [Cryptophyta sp. CCMP2293]
MLLDKGADPHAQTDDDDTPLDLASNEHVKEELLRAVMMPRCCAAWRLLRASVSGWARPRSTRVKLVRPVARPKDTSTSTPSWSAIHSLQMGSVAIPKTPAAETRTAGTISAVLGFPDPAPCSSSRSITSASRPPRRVPTIADTPTVEEHLEYPEAVQTPAVGVSSRTTTSRDSPAQEENQEEEDGGHGRVVGGATPGGVVRVPSGSTFAETSIEM